MPHDLSAYQKAPLFALLIKKGSSTIIADSDMKESKGS